MHSFFWIAVKVLWHTCSPDWFLTSHSMKPNLSIARYSHWIYIVEVWHSQAFWQKYHKTLNQGCYQNMMYIVLRHLRKWSCTGERNVPSAWSYRVFHGLMPIYPLFFFLSCRRYTFLSLKCQKNKCFLFMQCNMIQFYSCICLLAIHWLIDRKYILGVTKIV